MNKYTTTETKGAEVIRACEEMFALADVDGNGTVDMEELLALVQSKGILNNVVIFENNESSI